MNETAIGGVSKRTYRVRISASHEHLHLQLRNLTFKDTCDSLHSSILSNTQPGGPLGSFQKSNNDSHRQRAVCQEAKGAICLMSIFIPYLHPQFVQVGFKAIWYMLRKAVPIKISLSCTWDNACKTPPGTLLTNPRNPGHQILCFYYEKNGGKANNY